MTLFTLLISPFCILRIIDIIHHAPGTRIVYSRFKLAFTFLQILLRFCPHFFLSKDDAVVRHNSDYHRAADVRPMPWEFPRDLSTGGADDFARETPTWCVIELKREDVESDVSFSLA